MQYNEIIYFSHTFYTVHIYILYVDGINSTIVSNTSIDQNLFNHFFGVVISPINQYL